MFQRIAVMLMGILTAYATAYFGDEMRGWLSSIDFAAGGFGLLYAVFTIFVLIIITVVGIVCFCSTIADLDDFNASHYAATLCLIFLSLTFGVLATPFAVHGPLPWHWINMWSWVPLIAITPNVLLVAQMFDSSFGSKKLRQKKP